MGYLQSGNISVFPCANRDAKYIESKLTTEQNLTNIIRSIVSEDSFVISYSDSSIQFVLGGYYFEVKTQDNEIQQLLKGAGMTIYASIQLDGTAPYQEIQIIDAARKKDATLDTSGKFLGLSLTTEPTGSNYKSLLILSKSGTDPWKVPETSKLRLKSQTGNITVNIDDGQLE